jgi:hypothetical protein
MSDDFEHMYEHKHDRQLTLAREQVETASGKAESEHQKANLGLPALCPSGSILIDLLIAELQQITQRRAPIYQSSAMCSSLAGSHSRAATRTATANSTPARRDRAASDRRDWPNDIGDQCFGR